MQTHPREARSQTAQGPRLAAILLVSRQRADSLSTVSPTTPRRSEVRVFTLFESHPARWFTHHELAEEGKAAPRTVRAYTVKLVRLGLLDVAEVWPGHRYRLREKPEKRNIAYHQRLKAAQAVFGGK